MNSYIVFRKRLVSKRLIEDLLKHVQQRGFPPSFVLPGTGTGTESTVSERTRIGLRLDFVHRTGITNTRKHCFGNWIRSRPQVRRGKTLLCWVR
jgi:hypothetical protein